MDPRPLSWVLTALGESAPGLRPDISIRGVTTDSRSAGEGQLFVALRGDRFDGHRFVGEAFRRGAAAALICDDVNDLGGYRDRPVIRVPDTRTALPRLARQYRRGLEADIIAVTGSNGKTTVKDLIAHLLEPVGPVVAAQRSFNNDIGLPLTLLGMGADTRFGVVEMGTNRPGEIAELCRIALPDCGVVTNVGKAHLEGLGGVQGVAEEKGALVEALPGTGMAFLNHEDFLCLEMARRARCPTIRFGFDTSADLWGVRRTRVAGGISFYLYGKMEMLLPVPGLHNAMNALAAVGVALRCGVEPGVIQERLRTARLPDMRLSPRRVNGVTIVNDAYNANPGSVDAAIAELAAMPCEGRRTLVIGDMFELGAYADQLHRKVGTRAATAGLHRVWAVGGHAGDVERGLASVDRWCGEFCASATTEEAGQAVPFPLEPGDTVLVKGSRRMRMERLVELLAREAGGLEVKVPESIEG